MCGRDSRRGVKGIAVGLFLLLLVAFPCYSAASWGAFTSGSSGKAEPIVTIEEPIQEELSQNPSSGTVPETTSATPSTSSEVQSIPKAKDEAGLKEAISIVEDGGLWLSEADRTLLVEKITSADKSIATLKAASDAKDEEIADLKNDLAEADEAAGSKAYAMAEAIIGFEDSMPEYGVGVTLGSRIGNHVMVELGADYMIGKSSPLGFNDFSIDNFSFRAGIGYMF